MCARCFSSRRTRPFSAMIWSILSTVVYCVCLRAQIASCTSRTVVGPRLHNTVRISSSASVGLGSFSAIYRSEEHTSELQSLRHLVCRLLLEKKNTTPCRGAPPTLHDRTVPRLHRGPSG